MNGTDVDVEVLPSPLAAAHRLTDHLADAIGAAIAVRGRAVLALSGSSSPIPAFEALGRRAIDWPLVHLLQVDERQAPFGHPERNLTAQAAALPDGSWHPLPVPGDPPEALRRIGVEPQQEPASMATLLDHLDLVHLGLGTDGHTASWPPGVAIPDADPYVTVPEFNGWPRVTLTPHIVNRAPRIVWLITGADKRPMMERLLAGDPSIPAGLVRRGTGVVVITDQKVGG
jgi:6-phosphogluconolactonase/glucosamine-6-phosphate isomerase/deaminase